MRDGLVIEDLRVEFKVPSGRLRAVDGANLKVSPSRITALVGESGSGKSVTSLAVMDLLPKNAEVLSGKVSIDGVDVTSLSKRERARTRGRLVGMVFQNPVGTLDHLYTIGQQMIETIAYGRRCSKEEARCIAVSKLEDLDLRNPEVLLEEYPFNLSGGMCQRVSIAMALSLGPAYLIADEPTTALDVTVQKQILSEILSLSHCDGMGVLFVTHDLGVVAEIADDVCVMKNGGIVEHADVDSIFHSPKHSYTKQLLEALL